MREKVNYNKTFLKSAVSFILTEKRCALKVKAPRSETLEVEIFCTYSPTTNRKEKRRRFTTMKVAIIGAGVSGLASIKCCLDEGLQPVCFEKCADIGGLWKFSQDGGCSYSGSGSVYESTVINTSKEMTCFSDFPAPKHFPPFMPHGHVVEYLHMYAKRFDLLQHIHFNATVLEISRTENHRKTGQWKVSFQRGEGKVNEIIFDAVMICNGHLSKPFFPAFKGLDRFEGRKLHSHEYKSYRGFEDKVVLVVGMFL